MKLKDIIDVSTAEIIEGILHIKLANRRNTYFAYSLAFDKSYLVIIDRDSNIIDTQAVLLDPTEEKYIKSIIDGLQ